MVSFSYGVKYFCENEQSLLRIYKLFVFIVYNTREVIRVNIAFFLLPKSKIAFLYDDCSLRQGLEKIRHYGYTAIPVISKDNKYVGTVSEGDFLWYLVDDGKSIKKTKISDMESTPISRILDTKKNPPVGITSPIEDLVTSSINQNFVPVVDDLNNFIGIVTRSDILKYYYSNLGSALPGLTFVKAEQEVV